MSDAIDRAIDTAMANAQPPPVQIAEVAVPVLTEALELPADGGIRFNQLAAAAGHPRVLLLDLNTGAWQPVLLPPGTWSLQPASDDPPKPEIWTP